jgi:hypothetical protein
MNAQTAPDRPRRGSTILTVAAIASAVLLLPAGLLAAEPTPGESPAAVGSPATVPTLAPADAFCESVDDLRFIVTFLRDTDASEDGWLPIFVGATAAISEARQLAGAADDTYRPLVEDMVGSLEGVRSTAADLGELGTAGAKIAAIGQAITDIGNAMDALSVQLREPCPSAAPASDAAPPPSAPPAASEAPAG